MSKNLKHAKWCSLIFWFLYRNRGKEVKELAFCSGFFSLFREVAVFWWNLPGRSNLMVTGSFVWQWLFNLVQPLVSGCCLMAMYNDSMRSFLSRWFPAIYGCCDQCGKVFSSWLCIIICKSKHAVAYRHLGRLNKLQLFEFLLRAETHALVSVENTTTVDLDWAAVM